MRVFNDIGGRLVHGLDRIILGWLRQLGKGDAVGTGAVASLRLSALVCLAFLVLLPVLSFILLSPALALPVGAALVIATLLCGSAAALAVAGLKDAEQMETDTATDLLFEACPGFLLVCDAQGAVLKTGGRERDLLSSARRDLRGLTLAELVHVSDRIAVAQALDALRQGEAVARVDARIEKGLDAEGGRQFLPVRLELSGTMTADARLHSVLVQMRDISADIQLRDEVVLRTAEAQSANDTKSRFLAAVSHELRTPLNAILGFSDVLAGEYFGPLGNDRQREYVALIRQSGGHLLSVVNTMLDMSRIEAGRYDLLTEPFQVGEAVETCRAMLDLQARSKGVTLTARVARGLADVVADRRAVQQILINLAGNAIKFTQAGGVVSMDATQVGSNLLITVSDTGIGIAADKMALLGQPFMQVQDDYSRGFEGTGLGLSLVKGLVSLHGGQFAIESRLGEGTVVTVALPMEGPADDNAVHEAGEAMEFPPRLRSISELAANQEQGFAHERAKAKSA